MLRTTGMIIIGIGQCMEATFLPTAAEFEKDTAMVVGGVCFLCITFMFVSIICAPTKEEREKSKNESAG